MNQISRSTVLLGVLIAIFMFFVLYVQSSNTDNRSRAFNTDQQTLPDIANEAAREHGPEERVTNLIESIDLPDEAQFKERRKRESRGGVGFDTSWEVPNSTVQSVLADVEPLVTSDGWIIIEPPQHMEGGFEEYFVMMKENVRAHVFIEQEEDGSVSIEIETQLVYE